MAAVDRPVLSEREKDALRLLLAGHDAKSIARTLGLSVHTVNDRLREARRKLGVSSSREAARRLAVMEAGGPEILGCKEIGDGTTALPMAGTSRPAPPRASAHRLAWLTGGMLIMSLVIAAVALSSMVARPPEAPAHDAAPASAAAETDASAAARRWVQLLDAGQWDAAWRAAGTMLRTKLTAPQWADTIRPVRQPLGAVSARVLDSAAPTATLPGAPPGDYQLLQFHTRFAGRPDAVETVVLARERDGWRVDGYFIR